MLEIIGFNVRNEKYVGEMFLLDNNQEYIVVSTYEIDNDIYAYMINKQNINDAMFAKIIIDSEEIYVKELHDADITQKILEIIKKNSIV